MPLMKSVRPGGDGRACGARSGAAGPQRTEGDPLGDRLCCLRDRITSASEASKDTKRILIFRELRLAPLTKETMPRYEYRDLHPTAEAEEVYRRWLTHLDEEFTRHRRPALRAEIVRDNLHQLFLGRPHGGKLNFTLTSELPVNVLQLSLDPANATLEPEYYGDIDKEKYAERKPLIWFWQMFDRSPVGLNHWLGFRFRCMFGKHIFKSMGKNVKIFHGVEFSYGYNLTIEDNCVIHKYVMLDDRGELIIRKGTSLSGLCRSLLALPRPHRRL